MGLLICVLYILAGAALIAAVFYLVIWALGQIFSMAMPERVTQLLGLALFIYVIVACIVCFVGGDGAARFFPWSRPMP